MKSLLCIATFFFALAGVVLAQETRGSITGRVTDASGGVIKDAKVEATNYSNGVTLSSVANESGSYEIPYLLPGKYRVAVLAQGFNKLVRENIELRVNDRLKLDFTLEVGKVTETITITDSNTLVEAGTASIGNVIGERQASELPIVGGNAFYLARLSAGVLSTVGRGNGHNPFDGGSATTTITVNGTRSGSSEVTLDGAPNMVNNTTAFAPPQDLVQEFKINTAAYDASYGHAAGAVTNVSVKSGTQDLHGTVYDYDSRLRARPWFLNRFLYDTRTGPINERKIAEATPGSLRQRWGATATGPVVIPKLYNGRQKAFWSFGYEGVFVRTETTFTGAVPTLKQRQGDFSELLALGSQYQIYDPATIRAEPNGRFSRQPLAGNIIPNNRLDPVAKAILAFYPQPNTPGTSDGRQNYFRIAPRELLWHAYIGRLDYNFSERHRMFVRFNANTYWDLRQTLDTDAARNRTDRPGLGFVFDDVYVFNPQLLVNVRYGLTYQNSVTKLFTQGFDLAKLGFSSQLIGEINAKNNPAGIAFPEVVIDGYSTVGASGGTSFTPVYQTWQATLTRVIGSHSLRVGGDFRLLRESGYNFGNVAPRLEFSNTWTRGPLDTSAGAPIGQGLASFLLGVPTGGRVDINASRAQQSTFTSLFVQDDWKLGPKLSVNLGLRYEYEGPSNERFNRSLRGFDGFATNPIEAQARANYARNPIAEVPVDAFRALGGLTFAGVAGQPRGLWKGDRNNFAPRIGIAYQITPLTVIRAGYGIFYDLLGADRVDVNQGGFNQSTNIIPSLNNGLTFQAPLTNPFPLGLELPSGSSAGPRTSLGRGISFFDERSVNPYMQRWSLSVQRELPGKILLDLTYVGNRGTHLGATRDLNALPAQYLSTSSERDQARIDFLGRQVINPFFGISEFAGTGLSGQRVALSQLLRPYPHFTGVTVRLPDGYSYYHSLQVEVEKRLSRGFTFSASWTYSKFMEATAYLNASDPLPEKVISDQDYPHRLVISGIYELPFGKGKRFAGDANRLLDALIGGWQLQGLFEGQSGQALGFGNAIFRGDLKNIVLPRGERTAERWFNVDAGFERDPLRQLGSNLRRFPTRFSGIRGDGINNIDLSLFKNYRLSESKTLQFRIESFNALNHVQFDSPNTGPTSGGFGAITAEAGHGQRQLIFSLKFLY
ncbi:MAG: TonB-dependent receptor domain-containing protein [Blastocatellia bacterium]